MGGYGSGRTTWRGVLDHCLRLDVNRLHRDGCLSSHGRTSRIWRDEDGEITSSLGLQHAPEWIELEYTHRPGEENAEQVRYRVEITWTPCHYGRERPWFICPNQRCRRRVGKLYLWGRFFLCRHCTGAAYASQRWDRSDRLMERARKIRMRLGGGVNLLEPLPWKPKGMHWRTYWRLREEYHRANNASVVLIAQKFGIGL